MSPRSHGRSALSTAAATLLALILLAGVGVAAGWGTSRTTLVLDRVELGPGAHRIPRAAYEAYVAAATQATEIAPGCQVDWEILAGVARVESRHGQIDGSRVLDDGTVTPRVLGPPLNGRGVQAIADTDGGRLDGDMDWDRAVGPFQFIPTTWGELGRDGNGDGTADPHNMHDGALTAAALLCTRRPGDYSDPAQLRHALIGYNPSGYYADRVLRWVEIYRNGELADLLTG